MIEARVHWTVEIVLCQIKTSDDRAIDKIRVARQCPRLGEYHDVVSAGTRPASRPTNDTRWELAPAAFDNGLRQDEAAAVVITHHHDDSAS
ncbi:hypothetical protein MTX26_26170 [Bradyrhizobium sp. ISRA443]|uniref:hypothetical protein n=1 Tax=unclassified Bradyrhizobium TaxID=2631580 RepID=UPI0024796096|nr:MULTISPECIES: hypothetical protein [unclassified Bradyrhizobium]WGS04727.1 hypothetical protein MTX18_26170 [Bradyrhizobium sp. ISRA437]WGS11608.1 hypothetical protein MTX26_26170 [Bradyrhizobium sp. ISRA443]